MSLRIHALAGVSLVAIAGPALGEDAPQRRVPPAPDILVVGRAAPVAAADPSPATRATIDADAIRTRVNAANVEDTIKYLPSLLVRKRHIGDTQAPLATRTGGLGASARSLIYVDGVLLSALIGNNNGTASPRWGLVSPQEIDHVDILYGPFSAAYPGNAIGAVVNIATRTPDRLEASVSAGASVQDFDQYATHGHYPATRIGATIGDRFGALSLFASAERVVSDGQPLQYVTATAGSGSGSVPVTGAIAGLSRTGAANQILGASGLEHQRQDRFTLKASLAVTPGITLSYRGGLFLNATDAAAQTYLTATATGLPAYAGTFAIGGRPYVVAASAFSNGTYRFDERHSAHALAAEGKGARIEWRVIATRYRFDRDTLRTPTTALPAARDSGAGTITRLDGTGWTTLDGAVTWRPAAHRVTAGAHVDRVDLASNRYDTADWRVGGAGRLNQQALGRTRTAALWLEDGWQIAAPVTLTLGARQEWWRADRGVNYALSPAIAQVQPVRTAARLSPKASIAWTIDPRLTARLSLAQAWRFPTVGELYQVVTTPIPAVPNPTLRPERARSAQAALEWRDARGGARLSLFGEGVRDALISQAGPLNGTAVVATFVQNVDRTRARGVELAVDRRDVLPRIDLSGSVTYADATTRADAALPAAVGRTLPGVPHWKATLVTTWRPAEGVSLTAAGRYASRLWGTLDHSDIVGNTYQGFDRYLVVDLRAAFRVGAHYELGLGVDNVNNDRYFLFHPFPQRTFQADLTWRL